MAFTAGQKIRASQMSVHVCTSATRPIGHSGQLIYETDTGMLAIYSGSAWYPVLPTGEIASDAEYNATSNQTIAHATDTVLAFGTANQTCPLVTRNVSGTGHSFRLLRAGRWSIIATLRWAANSTGERFNAVRMGGANIASQGALLATGSSAITHNLSAVKRVTAAQAGTSAADVDAIAYQNSGANRDIEGYNPGGWGRFNFAWLGP